MKYLLSRVRRLSSLRVAAALVISLGAPTAAASEVEKPGSERPPFQREDVFELEWASAPEISPDARFVVYRRNSMDVMKDRRVSRLWLVSADGKTHQALSGADAQESAPTWSPDSSRIAYVRRTEQGSEVFLHWLASNRSVRLTQLPQTPKHLRFSPDGEQIAFSMHVTESPPLLVKPMKAPKEAQWAEPPRMTTRLHHERDGSGRIKPGTVQYFVLPAIGGTARQITHGRFRHDSAPSWSADGESLVFSGNRNENWEFEFANSEVYRVDLASGRVTALTDRNGPDRDPTVSPDGKRIAWRSYADRVQTYQVARLMVMNADGTGKREVNPELDRSIAAVRWNGAGNGLYYQYSDQGSTYVNFTRLSGAPRRAASALGGDVVARPYGGGSFSVAQNGTLAWTHSRPDRPADVALARTGGKERLLTDLNSDLLAHRTLGLVEEVNYRASTDGLPIQGWIVKPPGYDPARRYPLLVENHGGPVSHYGPHFSPEIQLYAAAGYLVFYPNPRGSTSYGEAFGNLLYNNYPGDDYTDVMDGVDYLLAQKLVTEDELYVTGGSAGGIMTAWMIGKNNRFRAAVVVKPVMNWISKTLTADNHFGYANYRYPGQPWENMANYMKFSPLSLVGSITTPTLVMVGDEDLRTPISEAKQLYHALKLRRIDTALVELPGAAHFIARRPSQLVSKIDHVLAWLAKYGPEGAADETVGESQDGLAPAGL